MFHLPEWLKLGVVGSFLIALAPVITVVVKDFLLVKHLEGWRQKRNAEQVYERLRDPLLASAKDLAFRLLEILDRWPEVTYLRKGVFQSQPEEQQRISDDDPYYKKYKLVSTLYRFCAFFGWLELYRQELTFLHAGQSSHSRQLEKVAADLRDCLANSHQNQAPDHAQWRDALLFREELRAIGETMLGKKGVIGYAQFTRQVESDSDLSQ